MTTKLIALDQHVSTQGSLPPSSHYSGTPNPQVKLSLCKYRAGIHRKMLTVLQMSEPEENPENNPRKSKKTHTFDRAHVPPSTASPSSRGATRKEPRRNVSPHQNTNLRQTQSPDDVFGSSSMDCRPDQGNDSRSEDDEFRDAANSREGSTTPTIEKPTDSVYDREPLESEQNLREMLKKNPMRLREAAIPFRFVTLEPFKEVSMVRSARANENPHFQFQPSFSRPAPGRLAEVCKNTGNFPVVTSTFSYLTQGLAESIINRIKDNPENWVALLIFNGGPALYNTPNGLDATMTSVLDDAGCDIASIHAPWLEDMLLNNGPKKRNLRSYEQGKDKYGGPHTTVIEINNNEAIELLTGIGSIGINGDIGFHAIRLSNSTRSWVLLHLIAANHRGNTSAYGQRLLHAVKEKASKDGEVIKVIGQCSPEGTAPTERVESWVKTFDIMYMGTLRKTGSVLHHWTVFAAPIAVNRDPMITDKFEASLRQHFRTTKHGEEVLYSFDGAMAKAKIAVSCTLCKADAHHLFQCPFYNREDESAKDGAPPYYALQPILGWTGPNKEVSRQAKDAPRDDDGNWNHQGNSGRGGRGGRGYNRGNGTSYHRGNGRGGRGYRSRGW